MAEEDIYGSKRKYERLMQGLDKLSEAPEKGSRRVHYCRNPANLAYFEKVHHHFESRDTSYIRRVRSFQRLTFITYATDKNLALCDRDDVDKIVGLSHRTNKSPDSKKDFLITIRWVWRILFPERDDSGRILDDVIPYPVKHLSCRIDRSKERRRNEKLTQAEFERLVTFFNTDPMMQAFVTLAVESLGRPQEMLYTTIGDVEAHENCAKVWISSHGKEGTKFLDCIESFPYVMRWLAQHPFQGDEHALLFCTQNHRDRPLHPASINKRLRVACERLGIKKRITGYSLKRNGVTFCRLRGKSDIEIQHKAGWTSTKQLKTYDLSSPQDTFHARLVRHGVVKEKKLATPKERRTCACGSVLGFADAVCVICRRPTDAERIKSDLRARGEAFEVVVQSEGAAEKISKSRSETFFMARFVGSLGG